MVEIDFYYNPKIMLPILFVNPTTPLNKTLWNFYKIFIRIHIMHVISKPI